MPDKNKIKYEFIDSSLTLNGAIKELEDYKIFYSSKRLNDFLITRSKKL